MLHLEHTDSALWHSFAYWLFVNSVASMLTLRSLPQSLSWPIQAPFSHISFILHFTHSTFHRFVWDECRHRRQTCQWQWLCSIIIFHLNPRASYLSRKCILTLRKKSAKKEKPIFFFTKKKSMWKMAVAQLMGKVSKSIGVKWCSIHFWFHSFWLCICCWGVAVVIGHHLQSFCAVFCESRLKFTERISVSNSLTHHTGIE